MCALRLPLEKLKKITAHTYHRRPQQQAKRRRRRRRKRRGHF
ncbi:hypothetical protein OAV88_00065 [bacterium]|nr:hypothetical protein [bacterium]